jgi:hypothetical protein
MWKNLGKKEKEWYCQRRWVMKTRTRDERGFCIEGWPRKERWRIVALVLIIAWELASQNSDLERGGVDTKVIHMQWWLWWLPVSHVTCMYPGEGGWWAFWQRGLLIQEPSFEGSHCGHTPHRSGKGALRLNVYLWCFFMYQEGPWEMKRKVKNYNTGFVFIRN